MKARMIIIPLLGLLASSPELSAQGPKPEAEVSIAKVPVKLTFRLYKTKVKKEEHLWHQLRLQNIGKEKLTIFDSVFSDPMSLLDSSMRHAHVYIEVLDPQGKPYQAHQPYLNEIDLSEPGISGLLEVNGPEEQAMVDRWRKSGLSPEEVNERLMAYNKRKMDDEAVKSAPPPKTIVLVPGQAIETRSWFYYTEWHRKLGRPEPHPIGEFQRLECFPFHHPGKYKIRAVYDYALSKKDIAELEAHGVSTYGSVRVRTPWITVEVTQ